MRILVLLLLLVASPAFAQDSPLVGNWKLVKYRVDGKIVTTVEKSWNEAWNGTEQRRFWRLEDGELFIESAPAPSPNFPGRKVVGRLVWERDK
jgi:hypothetical protein